jgi:hypothetical protein
MTISACDCCGNECTYWGTDYKNLCLQCAIDVFNEEEPGRGDRYYIGKTDPKVGNGLGKRYDHLIETVKARKRGKQSVVSASKTYTDTCPCGIHFSMCDYHRR